MNEKENKKSAMPQGEIVASSWECTGLMPVLPPNHYQNRNYARLYNILPARRKKRR